MQFYVKAKYLPMMRTSDTTKMAVDDEWCTAFTVAVLEILSTGFFPLPLLLSTRQKIILIFKNIILRSTGKSLGILRFLGLVNWSTVHGYVIFDLLDV